MRYTVDIPLEEEFKKWLIDEGKTTIKSADSYVSRLRRLFKIVLDEFFPKTKNKAEIRPFHVIFKVLHDRDQVNAAKLLDAMRELAFDKQFSNNRTRIKVESYSNCRTALERYAEFYGRQSISSRKTNSQLRANEKNAINDIIKKYQKKEFTKDELYKKIIFRRRTEGRYTGDIYYPIELIDTVLKKHSDENKNYIEKWLTKIVDKINVLIDTCGNSIQFKELRDGEAMALKIEKRSVFIFRQCGSKWEKVYTHTNKPGEVKVMNAAIFASIDIDHKVAISNMLNQLDNYPALAKLTELIKKDANFPKKEKKEQVKHLRGAFYDDNKDDLETMIDCIKSDLDKLLHEVKFEMMDGHANKKKSNK